MVLIIIVLGIICIIFGIQLKKAKSLYRRTLLSLERVQLNEQLLREWLLLKQINISLSDWLKENRIQNIAIYGYGDLGKAFYNEIKREDIDCSYIVDKNYRNIVCEVKAIGIDDIADINVDAIIISVVNYYDEIESEIMKRSKLPIISLEDIIYGVGINEIK